MFKENLHYIHHLILEDDRDIYNFQCQTILVKSLMKCGNLIINDHIRLINLADILEKLNETFEADKNNKIIEKLLLLYNNLAVNDQIDLKVDKYYILTFTIPEKKEVQIGDGYNPTSIANDILNLLSLHFKYAFEIKEFFHATNSSLLVYPYLLKDVFPNEKLFWDQIKFGSDENLQLLFDKIFKLRVEQFRFFEKVLTSFRQGLLNSVIDIRISIVLFITAIEVIASKYGELNKDEYYNTNYVKTINNQFNKMVIDFSNKYELDKEDITKMLTPRKNKLISSYISDKYHTTAKYKNILMRFSPGDFRKNNEKFLDFISDIYNYRSKVVHIADYDPFLSEKYGISYNDFNKKGNIKEDDGKAKIIRLPRYIFIRSFFRGVVLKFLDYLIENIENDEDKLRYNEKDFLARYQATVSVRKGVYLGGFISEDNYYHRIDFLKFSNIQVTKKKSIECWNST